MIEHVCAACQWPVWCHFFKKSRKGSFGGLSEVTTELAGKATFGDYMAFLGLAWVLVATTITVQVQSFVFIKPRVSLYG